jgi:rfaE bifunctional protein nucleotidyltransferase chain/domain
LSKLEIIHQKIVTREDALPILARWRLKDQKLVFTNGCFDILHGGHTTYLAKAATLGNKLIVGLNSDKSVKALNKGKDRPVQTEADRALNLASLHLVDLVIIFDEPTPFELISLLKPDILVKGGDYKLEEIVGSDIVRQGGGMVTTIPFVEGKSTTALIEKMK